MYLPTVFLAVDPDGKLTKLCQNELTGTTNPVSGEASEQHEQSIPVAGFFYVSLYSHVALTIVTLVAFNGCVSLF